LGADGAEIVLVLVSAAVGAYGTGAAVGAETVLVSAAVKRPPTSFVSHRRAGREVVEQADGP
jgi:hypothetical protein